MKKMFFLMVGLMLSAVLVMTAVGCDNGSSSNENSSAHAIIEGTWQSGSFKVNSVFYKVKLVISANSATHYEEESVDETTWKDYDTGAYTIVTSSVVDAVVTISAFDGEKVVDVTGTLSNSNNTFTTSSFGRHMVFTRQ